MKNYGKFSINLNVRLLTFYLSFSIYRIPLFD